MVLRFSANSKVFQSQGSKVFHKIKLPNMLPCLIFAYITSSGLGFKQIQVDELVDNVAIVGGFCLSVVRIVVTSPYIGVHTCHDSKHNSTTITDHHVAKTEFPDNLGAVATLIESRGRSLPNTFRSIPFTLETARAHWLRSMCKQQLFWCPKNSIQSNKLATFKINTE